jgi:hypothetical protein
MWTKKKKILKRVCISCRSPIGCYDQNKNRYTCKDCDGYCPLKGVKATHGVCDKCLKEAKIALQTMRALRKASDKRMRRLGLVQTD